MHKAKIKDKKNATKFTINYNIKTNEVLYGKKFRFLLMKYYYIKIKSKAI